jgi:two-component system, NarL family, nitrate/nitrite response regulator NarL
MTHALASPIRVVLLDHHALVRDGISMILATNPRIQVVGQTGSSQAALALVNGLAPDIILLELNLDGDLNTEIIPQMLATCPEARILLLTGLDEMPLLHLAIQMGAVGVVYKTEPRETLLKAVEKVHAGEVWIDRSMMASVLTTLVRSRQAPAVDPESERIATLSEREREVIGLIGVGLKNKEIAARLTISDVTVRHHLSSIYNKLGVDDRLELTVYAYRNGLAALPQ